MKATKLLQAILISGIPMLFAANANAALPAACGPACHNAPVAGASGVYPAVNLCSSTFTAAKQQTMSSSTGGAVTTAQIAAEITATCGGGTAPPPPPPAKLSGEASTKMYCGICHGLRIGDTRVTPDVTIPGIKPGGSKHMSGNQSASQYAQRIQKMQERGCPVPDAATINSMAKWMATVNK